MRLAYVVSLFPKLSETFILRELVELRRRGHEVTILSLKRERETLVQEEAVPFKDCTLYPRYGWATIAAALHWFSYRPVALLTVLARMTLAHLGHPAILLRSLGLIPASLQLAREVTRRRVEHLHAHWATYPALSAWIISRLTGVPFSVTGHAHDLLLPNPMLPVKLRDCCFFATISEFNRALLIQKCGTIALDRVRLIRCGIPLNAYPFATARRTDSAGADTPAVVVSVGRLVDYKGFDVLIRACAVLRDAGATVSCVIVGDGPEKERLAALIGKLGLARAVRLEPGHRQAEVARLIAGADIFALAAHPGRDGLHDGILVVLMEAMALGVPVISTKLSGIPELVADNRTGLLVAPGDAEHLAAAIRRLFGDPALAETLRRGGREMIEKEFELGHAVDGLETEMSRCRRRRR